MRNKTLPLLIVLVLTILALGGGYIAARSRTVNNTSPAIINTTSQRTYYSTQSECESTSGKSCRQVMCDYAPEGKTIEEVCGKNYKKGYWSAI